jgi:solute carrier family 25 thiamine pyrophosphate transporter 19
MVDWRDGIAGGVSGVTTRFFVAPLDVIKIRLQLQVISKDPISKASSHVKYQGVLQTLGLLVREEGVLALWKGNMTAEFLWGGYMASQFFTYRACQGIFDEHRSRQTLSHSMVAGDMMCGGIAGGIATVVTYPFDLIRTRLAAQPEPKVYSGLRQAAQQIVEQEGFAGLYRGLTPAFVAVVPYMGIQFAVYESLKRYFRQRERASPYLSQSHRSNVVGLDTSSGEKRGNVLEHLLCGCAAGSISKLSTLPLDVTKKRMQVSGLRKHKHSLNPKP